MGWIKDAVPSVGMDKNVCLFVLIRFLRGTLEQRELAIEELQSGTAV